MTSPGAAERRLLRQALMPRKRRREEVFLAEGVRIVRDLLATSFDIPFIAGVSSFWDSLEGVDLAHEADRRRIPRRTLDPDDLSALATTETPQPILAVGRIPERRMDHLLVPRSDGPAVVLVLDAVQDPGNAGTMIRTAEALGVAGVAALSGTVDLWSPKAVRAAAGSLFRVPVFRGSIPEVMDPLRSAEYAIFLADAAGETRTGPAADRSALVVGNEGAGVRPELVPYADRMVAVGMRGRAESLNVSAAAAILLYQMTSR